MYPSNTEGPADVPRYNHLLSKIQARTTTKKTDASLIELSKARGYDAEYQQILEALREGRRVGSL